MIQLHLPWLEISILAPLVGALWTARAGDPSVARRRSLFVCGATLLLVLCAWADLESLHLTGLDATEAHDRWSISQRVFGLDPFVIDEINAPLLPMAALLYFVTAIATLRTKMRRFSFASSLVSEAILLATLSCHLPWGIVGLLVAGAVPPVFELRSRGKSVRVYAIHMGLFAVMLVAGWAWASTAAPGAPAPIGALALLIAAVLLRSGIVPAHCWMTDLFENASFGTALLFVTPMVGVYAAVRLLLPIAPDWALRSLALISLFTAVYAAGMALVQKDARRFFCYLLLSHSSLVLVGLEIATPIGLTGALCLWVSVGLALTGFGLTLRAVEARLGPVSLDKYHGLYEHTSMLAAFYLITGLASIGFPGTIGFVGAELLFEGVIDVYPYVGLAVVLAAALNGIAILQTYFHVFTGRPFTASVSLQCRVSERIAVLTLAALILGGGLLPQPGLQSRHKAAQQIIHSRSGLATTEAADETEPPLPWFAESAADPRITATAAGVAYANSVFRTKLPNSQVLGGPVPPERLRESHFLDKVKLSMPQATSDAATTEIPRGNAEGFVKYFRYDIISGLLVFLIALPLCLGISLASGYPPLAGIFTAIIGALVTTFLSNSELTIKGPAAGLIVIAIGAIESFGGEGFAKGGGPADMKAYQMALAVGVVAAVGQIVLGLCRAGALSEFFPLSAVHGMLASIGVIIIAKQIPVALGVTAKGDPLVLLKNIPEYVREANPAIALIGLVSLAILFVWPVLRKRIPALKPIPGQLVVLLVAIPLGMFLDLLHTHSYTMQNHQYQLSDQYLVKMPDRVFGMFDYITHPDFSAIGTGNFWYWAMMFFLIGSLETMLSAKAVDLIDPWKRKTNMNRDLAAVGLANLGCAAVGGLPMISEIVRSRANIDNGARTRFADLWHGVFLLACVALIPTVLHRIPMAALAAMLIYTGTRLAHFNEFRSVAKIGIEQLTVFVATIIGVLATDLLMGIGIGIAVELGFLLLNGASIPAMFKAPMETFDRDATTRVIKVHKTAMFTNWLPLKGKIEAGLTERKNVIVDLADTKLVDHSVMEKLHELERDFKGAGLSLHAEGLHSHQPFSSHELAGRRRSAAV